MSPLSIIAFVISLIAFGYSLGGWIWVIREIHLEKKLNEEPIDFLKQIEVSIKMLNNDILE